MKCVIRDCDSESENGYLACNSLHGKMFKIIKNTLMQHTSPDADIDLSEWKWYIDRLPPTVEDAIYYGRFIK